MRLGFLTGDVADIEKAARFGFDGIELHAGAFLGGRPFDPPARRPILRRYASPGRVPSVTKWR